MAGDLHTEGRPVIYVAGNPDAYPLEYYDRESGCYQGVIPQLLARFSAQSRYELIYYSPGPSDQRKHLAENLQVDLISGCTQQELSTGRSLIPLFQASVQGETLDYCLYATQAAPQELLTELEAFCAAVPQQEITGLLVEASSLSPYPAALPIITVGLGVGLTLLLALILILIRHYRKRLGMARHALELDQTTGIGNAEYLHRCYTRLVNETNRPLYSLIYFHVETSSLLQLGGGQEVRHVLRSCAQVLAQRIAKTDAVARVSDTGFVMLKYSENTVRLSPWLSTLFQELYANLQSQNEREIHITAGIYPMQIGAHSLDEMIFYAEGEARAALGQRKECAFFSPESLNKIRLEQKLRRTVAHALEHQEFQLYIQLYVDAHTRRIVGGEALSRWLHPELGLLSPTLFVPVLEREGLTYQLDYQCLRNSCNFLEELEKHEIRNFFLSCNFSRHTFGAPDFVARCREIIDGYSFPRELLIFELTESVSVKNFSSIRANMLALKKYGVRIALDDFGEGFTSFSDLQEYPVDGIKLDKYLVDNALTKTGNSILRAMVQVGHEMGLTILAEGVESEEQAQMLQSIHCDVFQGFRFYPPLPQSEVKSKLCQPSQA